MGQIEKIFYDWEDDQTDSRELKEMYVNLECKLTDQIGQRKYLEIEELFMNCVLKEKEQAFRGGFQQATALWKEC